MANRDIDDVREMLDVLRAAGVKRVDLVPIGDMGNALKGVEFWEPATPAGFVDAAGKPVNLDEGMPILAKNPDDDETPGDVDTEAEIQKRNFEKKGG